jgi:hypothetical protein
MDSPLKYPVSVSCNVSEQGYVDLGRWTTCQFAIAPDQAQNLALLREVLEDLNVRIENADDLKVIVRGQADMWKQLDIRVLQEAMPQRCCKCGPTKSI